MIELSERAGLALLERRKADGLEGGRVLRLTADKGEYGLVIDDQRSTDNIIEHSQTPVLAVDKQLEDALPDSLIDVEDTHDGPRLSISPISA